jgi:hypothetical protein
MLIRRTSYVANVFTIDWDTTTNLFFQGAVLVPANPVGKPGPINVRLRLFAAHTDIQSAVTLTFHKRKFDANGNIAYDLAPGSVAKGLPGNTAGGETYNAANPVYDDEDYKWIIGKTFVWGHGATDHYGAYVYYQFKNFKTESLGEYKVKAQITYNNNVVTAEHFFTLK